MIKGFIRVVKRLVGIYESGYEYWVKLSDIHINPQFARSLVGKDKYKRNWQFYHRNGYCESRIILNKDFIPIDGYSSYKILKAAEGLNAKVPVLFTNNK